MTIRNWARLLALALIPLAPAAAAQDYPSKPIRIIVPFAPGGNVDITARTVAPVMAEILNQSVIVENRAGAGGMIGAEAAMRSPPDGYTLLMGSNSSLSVAPNLYSKWPYDPIKGIAPISNLQTVPFVLVVRDGLPAKSVADLIRLAKEKPGGLTMASAGNGSSNHLVGEWFQIETGVKFTHVPYKGGGPAMTDLLAGQVDLYFDQATTTVPNLKSGRIRALAVASERRWPALGDTPTFDEAGVKSFVVSNITGLVAPAGVPPETIAKLHAAVTKALAAPAVKERFAALGVEAVGDTPQQFAAFIEQDLARWKKVVQAAGVKVE
ncbi:MAG TPA: tripartite tricarboxylate transporter substrate binding protein [Burkholderiaceae bacterium]|nr:tripartite tricarboxylate transporter substrate binding protein [Burkholderiaceae bacterium]